VGCQSSPPVEFYTLEPLQLKLHSQNIITQPKTIGIGPITLPAILANQKIVTRSSGSTVKIAQFQQWASPLNDNMLEVIARNLSILQPGNIFRSYPWSVHGQVDLQVIIDIVQFDTLPGQSAILEANWSIKNENKNLTLKNGHTLYNRKLTDSSYQAGVATLSQLLAEFSLELATAIQNAPSETTNFTSPAEK
jgi:uncharacterized lipoprotein YmbA